MLMPPKTPKRRHNAAKKSMQQKKQCLVNDSQKTQRAKNGLTHLSFPLVTTTKIVFPECLVKPPTFPSLVTVFSSNSSTLSISTFLIIS